MAAELVGGAFLSAALQVAFERLASSDIRGFFRGRKPIDALLNKLHITLISVNQVLEDAEERQYWNSNVKKWVDELKHVVYVADDLLDEIAYEATRQKLEAESQTAASKVRGFFTSFANLFDKEIESRIQQVLADLEFLAKQKDVLGLKEGCGGGSEVGFGGKVSNRLPSTSLVDESRIYGRDADKEEIIKFLLSDEESDNQVSAISIVGMGGLGKTTLAQLVYNDKIVEKFELKAWVCVSDEFDVAGITRAILSELNCSRKRDEKLNQLQLNLKEKLMGKKFLLVLDDVWNEDPTKWEALQVPFLGGASGSKVLVTTRNKKVALVMNSVRVHDLQLLKEEDGWKLFTKHAFNDKDAGTYKNLELIGRKIVKKCEGLPLAIKTMGGLLHTKLSEQYWNKILESEIWQLSSDESKIIPALRLSYHYLSSRLKRCFAFCSIFPKDRPIDKDLLINMWMAEGLLHCPEGNKSAEEVGDESVSELESRSLFQQARSWIYEHCFIMHDLVNDLAKSVSGEFCVRIDEVELPDISTKARYFSTSYGEIPKAIYECKLLRSFVGVNEYLQGFHIALAPDLLTRFNYLRFLSLRRCGHINEFVDDISNLKHLRYLNLSSTPIVRLSDSICALHNLQTLDLDDCSSLVGLPPDMYKLINLCYLRLSQTGITKLPDSICKLHNLRTLSLRDCGSLTELPNDFHELINLRHLDLVGTKIREMPQHMGRLKHLQRLPMFFVGKQSGSNMMELGKVCNLGGTLSISQLENINDPMDAREANMRDKNCLDKLVLEWSENNEDSQNERFVLEALQPHFNLKEFTIKNYGGTRFADWFDASSLPNLASLELSKCKYCFCLPPLGQLPSLKKLSISGFEGLKEIGIEFYGNESSSIVFKSLESLQFLDMREWEEWMHCEGECFPCLQELSLISCPRLTNSLPPFPAGLKKLNICNCEELEPSLPKAVSITEATIPESGVTECWVEQILVTLPNLERLHLNNCPKLVSFPTCELFAPKLRYFSVANSSYLSSLWFKNCPRLGSLWLWNCPVLESFHNGCLPSGLVRLSIEECPILLKSCKEWGLHKLHSLQNLIISDDFENLDCFTGEGLLPPNLWELAFFDCPNLKTINYKSLLHLTSLRCLYIVNCPSLQCLPEQGLPNSLSFFHVGGNCPLLKQRYQDGVKISHTRVIIPND